jgi:hypothetical protein
MESSEVSNISRQSAPEKDFHYSTMQSMRILNKSPRETDGEFPKISAFKSGQPSNQKTNKNSTLPKSSGMKSDNISCSSSSSSSSVGDGSSKNKDDSIEMTLSTEAAKFSGQDSGNDKITSSNHVGNSYSYNNDNNSSSSSLISTYECVEPGNNETSTHTCSSGLAAFVAPETRQSSQPKAIRTEILFNPSYEEVPPDIDAYFETIIKKMKCEAFSPLELEEMRLGTF